MPPLSVRMKYALQQLRGKYAVVFTPKYLIIALNSTVLYLVSFFLVQFLTHLVTGITAYFSEISTTLNYTMVDFHIRYWDWTPEMVITVFSVPAIFAIMLTLLSALAFTRRHSSKGFFSRFRYFTRKQRARHRRAERKKEIDLQVQRLHHAAPAAEKAKPKRRLSWQLRLFGLWTLLHSANYFFSGMLYAFLFHRRFGYVIWYAFDSFIFDVLFAVIAFLSMIAIGYFYAAQFFNSGRLYFNSLNDRNRMPFMVSQAFIPFVAGTLITIALQIPVFDPSLILLNFALFFLLLPIPTRAAGMGSLHFDNHEKHAKIWWPWIIWSTIIVLSILVAEKIGIRISLP